MEILPVNGGEAVSLVALVFALVEAVKRLPWMQAADRRAWVLPLVAIVSAVGMVYAWEYVQHHAELVLSGLVIAMAATGFYKKNQQGVLAEAETHATTNAHPNVQ